MIPDEFRELARAVNNWGRWGPDDERGTLNLITDELVRRAAAAVRTGKRFALGLPLSTDGPQIGLLPGRINPLRTMVSVHQPEPLLRDPAGFQSSEDVVVMALQAATHWDALAHVSYDGRLYNGFPMESVSSSGAVRCGIDKLGPLVGRGVLLDVARALGRDRLDSGHALDASDLSAAEELGRVTVGEGDIVLLRTGHLQLLRKGRKADYCTGGPGPSMRSVRWFHERGVAALATDTYIFEVFPGERPDLMLPVHLLHLVEMGMTQGQNFDLERLAADCAEDGVYSFLLEATPQPFVAGLGTPVNPVAVK